MADVNGKVERIVIAEVISDELVGRMAVAVAPIKRSPLVVAGPVLVDTLLVVVLMVNLFG